MADRYEHYRRLEAAPPFENLDRGVRGEIYDPAWLLGKQWQLGEHQGEDAASPVAVSFSASYRPLDPLDGDLRMDPQIIPPEAIVESEPDDWWTAGRRIRIGITAGASLPPRDSADKRLLLSDLPAPYERFNGRGYDGYTLYRRRAELGLDALDPNPFADVPREPRDLWDPVELVYTAEFACAGRTLALERHSGGQIDWYSVDSDAPLPTPSPLPASSEVYPNRLRYPGAPNTRWWQIEDAKLDIGGFAPDRGHFATMLLIDLISAHSDDWFLFPIVAPTGHAVTLHDVRVRDSFGDVWTVTPPSDWSLFTVTGLDTTSLLIWPTVTTPLSGPALEDVVLGVDEDANVLWAVEQRVDGRDLPTAPTSDSIKPDGNGRPVLDSERKRYGYRPSTLMFPHWHPYQIADVNGKRRLVQGRLANLAVDPPEVMPEPRARVLSDPAAMPPAPAHLIEPATVPTLGLRLERRAMLARGTDGLPVLWAQRRRLPLLGPPAPRLRFDVLGEEFDTAS